MSRKAKRQPDGKLSVSPRERRIRRETGEERNRRRILDVAKNKRRG